VSWLRRHWFTLAGAACGAGAGVVGWLVSPEAGIAAAGACTAAFGAVATKWYGVVKTLTPAERAQLLERTAVTKRRGE